MKANYVQFLTMVLIIICILLPFAFGGCSSGNQLTNEELRLQRLYHTEVASDREYIVKPAGFSVRPVQEKFVTTYMKQINTDGVEFFTYNHAMDRDPRFYAGKLSTYFLNNSMYDSSHWALSNLRSLVEHSHKSSRIQAGRDSIFNLNGNTVCKFRWLIVDGGTRPLDTSQTNLGLSRDAEMIGAVIQNEKGSFLVYLVENKLATFRPHGPEVCVVGYDTIGQPEASSNMEARFQEWLKGIRFDVN